MFILGKKKSNFEWLKEKLEAISDVGERVRDDRITSKYGYHTALKLVAVRYVSDTFTNIARSDNRRVEGFDGAVYVDLFAGTGLVKVGDNEDIVAGSAPCAVTIGRGFNYSVMVEKDKDRCNALKERMSKILQKDEFDVVKGDCNEVIEDIIGRIEEKFTNPIVLAFVDPEGLEIKFRTLKALSDKFQSGVDPIK